MALAGFILVRIRLLTKESIHSLTLLLTFLLQPCIILKIYVTYSSSKDIRLFLYALLTFTVLHVFFFLISRILGLVFKLDAVEQVSLAFPNSGAFLVPIIEMLLQGQTVYLSLFLVLQNVFLWTYAQARIVGWRAIRIRQTILNPNFLVSVLGCLILFFGIKLPKMVQSTIISFGDAAPVLTMLIIGMLLGTANLRQLFGSARVYIVCALKMAVIPLVTVFVALAFQKEGSRLLSQEMWFLIIMISASPVAGTVTQICQLHEKSPEYSSAINSISTVSSLVFMPLTVLIYQTLLGAG